MRLSSSGIRRFTAFHYGIAGFGRGETPHTADAHGGRVGVGIIDPLPWVAAVPPDMQTPVKVLMSGYGLLKPSVSVRRNVTIWFSSVSVKPSFPTVMSRLFDTSGMGQQSTFSVVPARQCPDVTD